MHSIKVSFEGDIRRFAIERNSFAELKLLIAQLFSFKDDFNVKYKDDEGDWISLDSDSELSTALEVAKNTLYLSVQKQNEAAKFPILAPSAPVELPASPLVPLGDPERSTTLYPVLEKTVANEAMIISNVSPKILEKIAKKKEKSERKHILKERKHRQKGEKKALKHGFARLVEDVTIPWKTEIKPSEEFVKTWKVRNESGFIWVEGCKLTFKKGEVMAPVTFVPLPGPIADAQEFDISVTMKAPATEGCYKSVWRLTMPNGRFFGQPLLVKICVRKQPGEIPLQFEVAMKELEEMGFHEKALNLRLLARFRGDKDKVVYKLLKKQQKRNRPN